MKKLYLKPSTRVIDLQPRCMLTTSDGRYATSVKNSESFTFESSGIGDAEEDY